MTFAFSVQECGWKDTFLPSSAMRQGPSSKSRPVVDEQPGPPLSQRTRGAFSGFERASKNLFGMMLAPQRPAGVVV